MNNNLLFGGLAFIIAIFVLWYWYSNSDSMYNMGPMPMPAPEGKSIYEPFAENREYANPAKPTGQTTGLMENEEDDENVEKMTNQSCYPKNQLTPEELLPQDYSSTWAKCNPVGAGSLEGKNFLDAGWNIGINTVGQTLRNANLQLRSEPPNPNVVVSPFLNTTIEPDTNRRYFEIGQC